MDIIVEIGTEEQRQLITEELKVIQKIYASFDHPSPLKQIIIPEDFDAKINEIQGTDNYSSRREICLAIAKNIVKEDGIYLIFSKELFTAFQDNFTRLHMYLHELIHAYNVISKPDLKRESASEYQYLANLYILFDEYYVNRKAFEIIARLFPKTSFRYKKSNYCHFKGFIEAISDTKYYKGICDEINVFRYSASVATFIEKVRPYFDEIAKSIVYIYSYIDCTKKLKKFEPLILKSKFVNEKTIALIDFYRSKYSEDNFDLLDGRCLIENFMENFGMKFEDTKEGLYCHVKDI